MSTQTLNDLPEELLLSIFEHLNPSPPSIIKSRLEPSLELTYSETPTLKNISLVSRRWRRIALPLLFRYSRLRLDKITEIQESSNRFLQLVQRNHLQVYSLAIIAHHLTVERPSSQDDHSPQIADFWRKLLQETDATRVIIVAPPADLALLTHCAIDLSVEWAFEDMDYHILELKYIVPGDSNAPANRPSTHAALPTGGPYSHEISRDSIFMLRPWSYLGLNEGSFIKAYGTYHYFEHGPPSLILSIKNCFLSTWSSIRSFSYTAILPFSSQLDIRAILPHLEELDIKLAPDPSSGILNDKARTGRAQMEDCWQEFRMAYRAREFLVALAFTKP